LSSNIGSSLSNDAARSHRSPAPLRGPVDDHFPIGIGDLLGARLDSGDQLALAVGATRWRYSPTPSRNLCGITRPISHRLSAPQILSLTLMATPLSVEFGGAEPLKVAGRTQPLRDE
jgi:hypothetical protein